MVTLFARFLTRLMHFISILSIFLAYLWNIPTAPPYGTYISQWISYSRVSHNYDNFSSRLSMLAERLFNQGLSAQPSLRSQRVKTSSKDHVSKLSYNCTRHATTRYSPYYLLFGRSPRLSINLLFNLLKEEKETASLPEYVKKWKGALHEALNIACKHAYAKAESKF